MPPTHRDEGLRAALVIRRTWPDTKILVLSQYVEERYAADLMTGELNGVGYLLKDRVADADPGPLPPPGPPGHPDPARARGAGG